MKRIVIAVCFVLFLASGSICNAQSNSRKGIVFECVSPIAVVKGAGCYLLDTGDRVLRGVGDIVTAPFKAKLCIPHSRRYIYRPPVWTPPTLKPFPKHVVPLRLHIKPVPDIKEESTSPLKFYQPLYYPTKNHRIAYVGG